MTDARSTDKVQAGVVNRWSHKLAELFGAASSSETTDVERMSWRSIKRLAVDSYRQQGYEVRELDDAGAHAGADLVLTKSTQRLLVSCKHWKSRKIGEKIVRELYGTMAAQNATGAILISCGSVSLDASRFANLGHIKLVDAVQLQQQLLQAQPVWREAPLPRSAAG